MSPYLDLVKAARRGVFRKAGAAEHAALQDHTRNPFHAVLVRHGFVHAETAHRQNPFARDNPRADYTEHRYTHPGHGRSQVVITQYHAPSPARRRGDPPHTWVFRYEQPNGIMAPSTGTTRPQLDRALTREFGAPAAVVKAAPKGWEGTVKRMKRHRDITNPWALAWWLKHHGAHPHRAKKKKG